MRDYSIYPIVPAISYYDKKLVSDFITNYGLRDFINGYYERPLSLGKCVSYLFLIQGTLYQFGTNYDDSVTPYAQSFFLHNDYSLVFDNRSNYIPIPCDPYDKIIVDLDNVPTPDDIKESVRSLFKYPLKPVINAEPPIVKRINPKKLPINIIVFDNNDTKSRIECERLSNIRLTDILEKSFGDAIQFYCDGKKFFDYVIPMFPKTNKYYAKRRYCFMRRVDNMESFETWMRKNGNSNVHVLVTDISNTKQFSNICKVAKCFPHTKIYGLLPDSNLVCKV